VSGISSDTRELVCRDAVWLGVDLDAAANDGGGPRISSASSRVAAWVIPTNEELFLRAHPMRQVHMGAIARHASSPRILDRQSRVA